MTRDGVVSVEYRVLNGLVFHFVKDFVVDDGLNRITSALLFLSHTISIGRVLSVLLLWIPSIIPFQSLSSVRSIDQITTVTSSFGRITFLFCIMAVFRFLLLNS